MKLKIFKKIKSYNPTEFWTFIIASATIVNLLVALLMWSINISQLNFNKRAFKTINRPFIGVQKIETSSPDFKNKLLNMKIVLLNFGNIPAKHVKINTETYYNNKMQIKPDSSKAEAVIFPNVLLSNDGKIENYNFDLIFHNNYKYKVSVTITYQGIKEIEYKTKQIFEYNKNKNSFIYIDGYWK